MFLSTASGKTEHIFQMGAPQYVLLTYVDMYACICVHTWPAT